MKSPQSKTAIGIQFSSIYLYSILLESRLSQGAYGTQSPTSQYHSPWLLFFFHHKIARHNFRTFHKH